jgi:glycerol-3-phosphate dehydrogenase
VLLGSTDIRVDSPGDVRCEDHEVDYILKSLSYVFPGIAVKPEHIVYRYSGVRPLPRSDASFTGSISRDHLVEELPGTPPILCLVGGKWTTFRAFGEQTADKAMALLGTTRRVDTADRRIGGGAGYPDNEAGVSALADSLVREFGVTPERVRHAIDHYGSNAGAVLEFCRTMADAAIDDTAYTEAELRYLVRREFARTPADLLQRRTSLAISGTLSSIAISQAARILADELGWSADESTRQEASFRRRLADDHGLTPPILAARDRNTGSLECA